MADNIRVLNYVPKRDPKGRDQLWVVFLFPVNNPVPVADAVSAQVSAAISKQGSKGALTPGVDPVEVDAAWKSVPTAVRYEPSGAVSQVGIEQIPLAVAAVLDPDEKAAVVAGTLAFFVPTQPIFLDSTGTEVTITKIIADTAGVVNDINDPTSKLWRALNLMWNQAHKDVNVGYDAQRAVLGARLSEVVIDDLANIPVELRPDTVTTK